MKIIDYDNYEGIIKDISEAPIEDELTKEEILYYVKKDFEEYNNPNRGEIVFVKCFLYLNGNIGKNHLFIITDKSKVSNFHYYGMLISS